jgi:hypothetical protein
MGRANEYISESLESDGCGFFDGIGDTDAKQRHYLRVAFEAAIRLHAYMTFRAKEEGLSHGIPVPQYAAWIACGCRSFYGVEIGDSGELVIDSENPDTFAAWRFSGGLVAAEQAVKRSREQACSILPGTKLTRKRR